MASRAETKTPNDLLFQAVEFATLRHTGQLRKDVAMPYIVHPLRVAETLVRSNCSDEVIIAGILHDVVEDTQTSLEEVEQLFGPTVARIVKGVSEPDKSDTWDNRKQHTLDYLLVAPEDELLVALADKLDNITSLVIAHHQLGDNVWDHFARSEERMAWYYTSLSQVFETRLDQNPGLSILSDYQRQLGKVFP